MLAVTLAVMLSMEPAEPQCPADVRRRDDKRVASEVKDGFPGTAPQILTCRCSSGRSCEEREYTVAPIVYESTPHAVKLEIETRVQVSARSVHLTPIVSTRIADALASRIRQHPLTAALFTDKALACRAMSQRLSCAEASQTTRRDLASELSPSGQTLRFEFDWPNQRFALVAWSMRASQVPETVPGWKVTKELREVKAFLKAHPDAAAELYQSMKPMIVVQADGAGVVVKFSGGPGWETIGPGMVISVSTDLQARYGP